MSAPSECVKRKELQNFKREGYDNAIFGGGRGGPRFFFGLESYYFCELGAHAKIRNPRTTPSGILVTVVRVKEERFIQKRVAYLVARTSLGPRDTLIISALLV